jgi:hypothetical protein
VPHSGLVEEAMTDLPDWITPGEAATLIWYDAVEARPGGLRAYQVAGPVLERAPATPYFLLAPLAEDGFAGRLYRDDVTLSDLRRFLERCILAEGEMGETLDLVVTRAEAPPLSVLDGWRALPERPLVPYHDALDAFLGDGPPVYVSPEAYARARGAPEGFATASVCAGCGEAEDAGVFFWTLARDHRIRVCLLIQNVGGRWTCRLHPFDFEAASA